jgi:hypothetical protein
LTVRGGKRPRSRKAIDCPFPSLVILEEIARFTEDAIGFEDIEAISSMFRSISLEAGHAETS